MSWIVYTEWAPALKKIKCLLKFVKSFVRCLSQSFPVITPFVPFWFNFRLCSYFGLFLIHRKIDQSIVLNSSGSTFQDDLTITTLRFYTPAT